MRHARSKDRPPPTNLILPRARKCGWERAVESGASTAGGLRSGVLVPTCPAFREQPSGAAFLAGSNR